MCENDNMIPEEQEAFIKWWNENVPKECTTILNPVEYANATRAIKKIRSVIRSCYEDENEMPEFTIEYTPFYSTCLSLTVRTPEYDGLDISASRAAEVIDILPANCMIGMLPTNDNRILIEFTFPHIREPIAFGEKGE
jgi:hypothetical protein